MINILYLNQSVSPIKISATPVNIKHIPSAIFLLIFYFLKMLSITRETIIAMLFAITLPNDNLVLDKEK